MTMTESEARSKIKYRIANEMRKAGENKEEYEDLEIAIQALKEIREYRAIGSVEEFKALKEKNDKDFELLLKAVKESYPMFKGAYVEFDVFMGDVMRRFTRERK